VDDNLPEKSQPESDSKGVQAAASDTTEPAVNKNADVNAVGEQPPSPPPLSRSESSSASRSKSGPGWIVWVITLLIALAGAAGSAYLWKSAEDQQHQLRADVAGAIQRVDEQKGLVRDVRRELDRYEGLLREQRQRNQQQVDQLSQQLASQQKHIRSLSTTDRNDWLLAEVEYLLHLANQRLLMGKEIKGAQQLLNAADEIVRDLNDYALFPVRKALADDMAALHSVGRFDVEGLYLLLEAAAKQADQLRLIAELQLDTTITPMPEAENVQQRLEFGVQAALKKLEKYIQYKRRDDIYEPTMAPEFEPAVRQNVRLMFEQAQMALLAGKQPLYDKSLVKAKQWLEKYYTLDQEATAKIVATIGQLQQQRVAVVLPDISGSSNALKDYLDSLHVKNKNNKQKPNSQQNKNASSLSEAATVTEGEGDAGQSL
jgi:uroporphyrin-III C-methyltransferase